MSYSTKFRSALYAPFRLAVDSTPNTERWYQLDVRDRDAAVKSSINYSSQGADFLMVKPGMSSIDLIKPIMDATGKPVGVYQTSGEWVAIQSSTVKDKLLQESMWVFIRAGADFMISYGARLLQKSLK
jgi:porphobilinogen synthase